MIAVGLIIAVYTMARLIQIPLQLADQKGKEDFGTYGVLVLLSSIVALMIITLCALCILFTGVRF